MIGEAAGRDVFIKDGARIARDRDAIGPRHQLAVLPRDGDPGYPGSQSPRSAWESGFENSDIDAGLGQKQGCCRTGRAAADNDDRVAASQGSMRISQIAADRA